MKQLICTVLLLAANLLSAQQKTDNHEWKVTIKVVDENSSPVPGARAGVGYYSNSTPASIDGLTDADGVFEASHSTGPSLLGYDLGIEAEKNGYYAARRSANLKAQYDPVGWSPTINLLLKKVGKPIPMYAKREETKVQKEDEPVGFDLVAGDWVAPYGTGRNGDMLFTVHRKVVGDRDYEEAVKLAFPNKGDGIAVAPVEPDTGSVFKTSRDRKSVV
jgi:hypothetical protein